MLTIGISKSTSVWSDQEACLLGLSWPPTPSQGRSSWDSVSSVASEPGGGGESGREGAGRGRASGTGESIPSMCPRPCASASRRLGCDVCRPLCPRAAVPAERTRTGAHTCSHVAQLGISPTRSRILAIHRWTPLGRRESRGPFCGPHIANWQSGGGVQKGGGLSKVQRRGNTPRSPGASWGAGPMLRRYNRRGSGRTPESLPSCHPAGASQGTVGTRRWDPSFPARGSSWVGKAQCDES